MNHEPNFHEYGVLGIEVNCTTVLCGAGEAGSRTGGEPKRVTSPLFHIKADEVDGVA